MYPMVGRSVARTRRTVMVWWSWGLIAWAVLASAGVVILTAVCTLRRRRAARARAGVEVGPSSAPPSGTRSTQPLDHLRPALAAAGEPAQRDVRSRALERLLEGARAGDYTLPP